MNHEYRPLLPPVGCSQEFKTAFIYVVCVGSVASAVEHWVFGYYLRAKLTPTTPINEIKEGSAEVKGTVKVIGSLLKSPISHQDCVLYAVIFHGGGGIDRVTGHRTITRGTSTLFWEIQSTPYVLDTELELLNLMELNWS